MVVVVLWTMLTMMMMMAVCWCVCADRQSTASYSDSAFDYLSSIIIDTTPQHGRHFFDVNCQVCTGKIPDPLYDDDRKSAITAQATTSDETAVSEDTASAPAVVNMSRDPRRSRAVQVANPVVPAAVVVKTELQKPETPVKLEPSPRETPILELVKSELPPTPKSPTSNASMVLPPLPAYQLWVHDGFDFVLSSSSVTV